MLEFEKVADGSWGHEPRRSVSGSHTHASGYVMDGDNQITYKQPPSMQDIKNLTISETRTVFTRREDKVYIYNSRGVQAIIPTSSYIKKH